MPTQKPRVNRKLKVAKVAIDKGTEGTKEPKESPGSSVPFVSSAPSGSSAPLATRPSLRCLFAAAAIIIFPLFTLPWALEAHEFYKMILLGAAVAVGLGFVLSDALRKGEFTLIPRHPVVALGLVTLVLALISALRSGLGVTALVGYGGTEALSVLGLLLLGLWVLLVYHGGRESFGLIYKSLAISGSVLGLVTILSLIGLKLYWFIPAAGFNPAGTTTVAGIIAAVSFILWLGRLHLRPMWLNLSGLILPLILLFGIDFRAPWIVLAVGVGMLLFLGFIKRLAVAKVALVSMLVVLALAILGATTNLIPSFLATPLEVAPSHQETWSVVTQTLNESPLLGSGPASFAKEYLHFRSLPILQTLFWNVAFDWGSSAGLTWLGNLGWIGGILMFIAVLSVLSWYGWNLLRHSEERSDEESLTAHMRLPAGLSADKAGKAGVRSFTVFRMTLWSAALALFVGAFLAPMPLALSFMLATMLGLMLAKSAPPLLTALKKSTPFISAVLILAIVGLGILVTKRAIAEVLVSRALASATLTTVENGLARALRFESQNDTYLRLLAETRRGILRELLAQPNTQDPTALDALRTAVDRTLAPARAATALAPNNVSHWVTLGNIYLEIVPFTSGASQAAVESFSRASALSPSDPAILTNLAVAKSLAATGEENTKEAQELLQKAQTIRPNFAFSALELARLHGRNKKIDEAVVAYRQALALAPQDAALRFELGLFLMQNNKKDEARTELEEAVRLAPQFSNARWFLAQLLEDQGDLAGAIAQIEKVLELNSDNLQAQARLEELKNKVIK